MECARGIRVEAHLLKDEEEGEALPTLQVVTTTADPLLRARAAARGAESKPSSPSSALTAYRRKPPLKRLTPTISPRRISPKPLPHRLKHGINIAFSLTPIGIHPVPPRWTALAACCCCTIIRQQFDTGLFFIPQQSEYRRFSITKCPSS